MINVREKDKAEKEDKACGQRVEVVIPDWMVWAGLSQKAACEQDCSSLSALAKMSAPARGGAGGRGLAAKEAVPVPGRSPQFRADYVCAPGIAQSQLSGTTSFSRACHFLLRHAVATAVPTVILPQQRPRKFSEKGRLSVPGRRRQLPGQPGQRCHSGAPHGCCSAPRGL